MLSQRIPFPPDALAILLKDVSAKAMRSCTTSSAPNRRRRPDFCLHDNFDGFYPGIGSLVIPATDADQCISVLLDKFFGPSLPWLEFQMRRHFSSPSGNWVPSRWRCHFTLEYMSISTSCKLKSIKRMATIDVAKALLLEHRDRLKAHGIAVARFPELELWLKFHARSRQLVLIKQEGSAGHPVLNGLNSWVGSRGREKFRSAPTFETFRKTVSVLARFTWVGKKPQLFSVKLFKFRPDSQHFAES